MHARVSFWQGTETQFGQTPGQHVKKGITGMLVLLYHADAVWWGKDAYMNVCKEFSTVVKGTYTTQVS